MYPQPTPDPNAPKRMTRAAHYDDAERDAQQAREAVSGVGTRTAEDWRYSQWCQLQGIIHALLGQK
jgi:hypothetical protein